MPAVKDICKQAFGELRPGYEGAALDYIKNARLNVIAGKPDLGYTVSSTK